MRPDDPPSNATVTYRQEYRRCGKQDCPSCRPGLAGHGPYWYARWQEGGRTRSRYLGRQAPAEAGGPAPALLGLSPTAVVDMDLSGVAREREGERPDDTFLLRHPAWETSLDAPPAVENPRNAGYPPARPHLRVQTLGAFKVWRGDELIASARWSRPTVAALFKCLLTAPGHRLSREQAIDLLWPEADPERAAATLRVAVHRLRAVLDEPGATASYVRSEGPLLVLDPWPPPAPARRPRSVAGDVPRDATAEAERDWLDADLFARAAGAALAGRDTAQGHAALTLYEGDYLQDDPYEDWAAARREELRQQRHTLLLHLARLYADGGDEAQAIHCLRLLLAADPCHEPAARLLMRLLAAGGSRAEALRSYDALARALRDDLDVVPTPKTEAVRAALLASETASAVPTPPLPVPTNLPAALTSFIGRGRELAAIEHALAQGPVGCRLLTLTGIGGCGKTRLALQTADAVRAGYADGVWLVELAALVDGALVPAAIAAPLGLRETPDEPLLATLANALRTRRMLLVLDNCEHLVAACAGAATTLLRACPGLQIVATSREALGMAGEAVWRVPALALPPPLDTPRGGVVASRAAGAIELERLERFEAVQLFLERARAVRSDFALSAYNASAVAEVCRRLDGLPLAIELAAARLGALSAQEVAARLHDRFRLLKTGNRAALPRHQTLRGVLDWSYNLLSAEEQALLRRLAVFAGGWTLAAAESVCTGGPVQAGDVADLLAGLEAKSLALTPATPAATGESRYGLLETVRQYAGERLTASGEAEATRDAHAAYVLALAERAATGLFGPEQRDWLDRLEVEHDNMRAALAWSARDGDSAPSVAAVQLAGALGQFWLLHGHLGEGRRWLTRVLAQEGGRPDGALGPDRVARARVLNAAGMLAERQQEYGVAVDLLEKSLSLYRASGDRRGSVNALNGLGLVAWDRGDYPRALALHRENLALRHALGDKRGIANALNNLAIVCKYQGDAAGAIAFYEQSLTLWKELGEPWGLANVFSNLGIEMYERGDHERALALHEESLALRRDLGDTLGISWSLTNVATVCARLGRHERAVVLFEESLALARRLGDRATITDAVEGLAEVAAALAHMGRAARLFAAVEALRAATGDPQSPAERARYDRNIAAVRASLGDDPFATAWAAGRSMTLEETIIYACDSHVSQRGDL